MLGLIALLIFFMFRNGRKRQQAMQELQAGLRPGAEVMLQSGIFATVESVDEEQNRVTVLSGTSTLVVHRNAVAQIVTAVEDPESGDRLAPDDDPAFGERIEDATASDGPNSGAAASNAPVRDASADDLSAPGSSAERPSDDEGTEGEAPGEDRKA